MTDKILNSFDVWITAQGWKSKLKLRSVDNTDLVGISRLRELILELAVRGKLVPQVSTDEPASQLLAKIELEKDRPHEDGRIKKQKPFPKINEVPFVLPEGWKWTRLGVIGNIFNGNSISSSEKEAKYTGVEGLPFIATKDVGYGFEKLDYENGIYIPTVEKNFKVAKAGTVLICSEGGSAGKKCGLTTKDICFGNKLYANELFGKIHPRYLLAFYQTPTFFKEFKEGMTGIIGGISLSNFIELKFPLPPLPEQHRIVAKVDELMALCDELEQQETNHLKSHQLLVETLLGTLTQAKDAAEFQTAWATLAQHFDDLFITEDSIDQLKQTILQLAVMGKLVKQDPKDEPASVLLERIKKEKERLIKEGTIKKEKTLSEIVDKEKPFELQRGWQFERLLNLCEVITKGSSPKWQGISYTENNSDVLFVTSENVGNYELLLSERKYVERKFNEIEPRSVLRMGDFLMNIVGGSIGRTAIYNIDDLANINQAVCLIRVLPNFVDSQFLLHFFNSQICVSYMFDKQVDNARANLSMGNISNFLIPIPPSKEQKRIVSKVNELFALCDSLKERITESQKVANLMAEAVLEQVE